MSDSDFRRPGESDGDGKPPARDDAALRDDATEAFVPITDAEAAAQFSDETLCFRRDGSPSAIQPDDSQTTVLPGCPNSDGETPRTKTPILLFSKIPLPAAIIAGGTVLAAFLLILTVLSLGGNKAPVETDDPFLTQTPLITEAPSPTPDTSPSLTPEATPSLTPEAVDPTHINPLTGVLLNDTSLYGNRPIALMHNNIKDALPMHGISQADILYEMLAEGNITRLVGLYQEYDSVVSFGAVRSTRTYYLELAMAHDAVMVHAGASYIAYNDISRWNLKTIDGTKGTYGRYFWRDKDRVNSGYSLEHTLFTSGANIQKAVEAMNRSKHDEGYTEPLLFTYDGTPADGEIAEKINVQFMSTKTTSFQYDSRRSLYNVMEFGGAMMDGSTNSQVAVTNVLILKADISQIPNDTEGRRSADLTSGGDGYFASGGRYIPIRWSRTAYNAPFAYTTEDGKPLELGAGKSYICIVPNSAPQPAFLQS